MAAPAAGPNQWIADDAPGLVRTRRASSHVAILVLARARDDD
ncbi:hypothetical protein [Variovorax sp. W2I14]